MICVSTGFFIMFLFNRGRRVVFVFIVIRLFILWLFVAVVK